MVECRWPWSRKASSLPRTHSATAVDVRAQRDRGDRQPLPPLGRLAHHALDVGADERRQVGLVDHQQVGAGDAGAALARDVVARGDVDDEDLHVRERGGEDRGQVVAAALDEDDVQRTGRRLELLDRLEVGGDVVADRGVRAAAGLDGGDALDRQHARGAQELGVLGRVDVVGHDAQAGLGAQRAAQRGDQAALAGPDGAADADPECSFNWQRVALSVRDGWAPRARSRPRRARAADRGRRHRARHQRQLRSEIGEPARGHGRVERQQLQRSGRDGRRVVIQREQRDVLVAEAGGRRDDAERDRPRRPRRLDPVARDHAPGPHRRRRAQQLRPSRRAPSRSTGLGVRAAHSRPAPLYPTRIPCPRYTCCMRGGPRRRSGRRPRRRGAGGRG